MADPRCPECKDTNNITNQKMMGSDIILIYCTNCGHIIAVLSSK